MANNSLTIHVFGFSQTQIIRHDSNKTVDSAALTTLSTFVDHVTSFKPADVTSADYHAIHVFKDSRVKYLGRPTEEKSKVSFSVKWEDLDQAIVTAFTDELIALADAPVEVPTEPAG